MNFEWIAMEHQRLHLIEEWPEGSYKEAALAAVHSTLEGLLRVHRPGLALPVCEICLNRLNRATLVEFPRLSQTEQPRTNLAA